MASSSSSVDTTTTTDIGQVRRMSYVELRILAKSLELNIKGKLKTEKLRDAIMECIVDNDDKLDSSSSQNTPTAGDKFVKMDKTVQHKTRKCIKPTTHDQACGQTPLTRSYNLRSKMVVDNQPARSLIPRPKKQDRNLKVGTTPDFKVIHKMAFDKMESLPEYASRKELLRNNYKMLHKTGRIMPKKHAINKSEEENVFEPKVLTTKDIKFNFGGLAAKTPLKENASQTNVSKTGFNLQKSLSKKLSYKPHTGPLPPLNAVPQRTKDRMVNREILKGVRLNRRFNLQLKTRGLIN